MKKILIALLMISVFACNKDDEDQLPSSANELLDFQVEASSNFTSIRTYIDTLNGEIQLFNATDFKESDFPITLTPELLMSDGAKVIPASGTSVTFSNAEDFMKYTITSGDGLNTKEYIFTIRDGQVPNGDFENWFSEIGMNSLPFPEPGKHKESTVWATANMGTSIYSTYGTSPLTEGSNTMIKIETIASIGLPIIAGALYIGKFDIVSAMSDPTNPVAAAILGIPFFERPAAVKFKYSYKAGKQMIQAVPKEPGNLFGGFDVYNLEGKDKFGIELALEKREGENISVIAKTNFQSDQDIEKLTELTLPFTYLLNETPTHFYISFSPSFDGGTFKGSIGSTLIIDDIELIYD